MLLSGDFLFVPTVWVPFKSCGDVRPSFILYPTGMHNTQLLFLFLFLMNISKKKKGKCIIELYFFHFFFLVLFSKNKDHVTWPVKKSGRTSHFYTTRYKW